MSDHFHVMHPVLLKGQFSCFLKIPWKPILPLHAESKPKRSASGVAEVHRLEHLWPCRLNHRAVSKLVVGQQRVGCRACHTYSSLDVSLQEKFKPHLRKANNTSQWNVLEARRIMKLYISSFPTQGKSFALSLGGCSDFRSCPESQSN